MRNRGSPHTVTYKDLVDQARAAEAAAATMLAGARARGMRNLDPLIHAHAVAQTMHRMLKKGLPGKQTDFLTLFEQTK